MEPSTVPHQKDPRHVASGRASQSPEALALRIARRWEAGTLTAHQQQIIKVALMPLLCPQGGATP
jgi:hypothetical protein